MLPEISISPIEFLRPLWLLGLITVIVFSVLRYKKSNNAVHQGLIAPHLSGNIVSQGNQSNKLQFAFSFMAAIACIALSGPTWRSIDMPVYEMEKAQVIAFDLSYSMFASDIKPNRLSQAKYKAIDLVKQWSEGEKALIAYAGDAFTITPLTRDGNSLINHIPNLSPDIMPVRGSRADLALDKAIELLKNAGYNQGHIVFISDDIAKSQAKQMVQKLKDENWTVSILAVATDQGAPIKLSDGSLLKNKSGEIVVPTLEAQPLYDIAQATNGLYLTSSNDSSDIQQLGSFYDNKQAQARKKGAEQAASDQFSIDDGYWLSFILLPLFLLLFRKGLFFALLLTITLPFTSQSLEAAETSIWKNNQQNAFQAFQDEDYKKANELYDSPLEQGSALYKDKQYEQALEKFTSATTTQPNNANAFYNQGNSYAQLQQFDEAIQSYDKALAINPELQQAKNNKALVEKIKQQQKQDQQSQDSEQQQDEEQQSQDSEQQSEEQQSQDSEQQSEEQQSQESEQQSEEQQSQESEQQNEDQQSQDAEQQKNADKQSQESEQQPEQEQQAQETESDETEQQSAQLSETDEDVNEEMEALPNWLKNMPDDPSILLRRKMQVEYQKRAQSQPVNQQPSNGAIW